MRRFLAFFQHDLHAAAHVAMERSDCIDVHNRAAINLKEDFGIVFTDQILDVPKFQSIGD